MNYVCTRCNSLVVNKWVELPAMGMMAANGTHIPYLCTNGECDYSTPGYPKPPNWAREG